MDEPSPSGRTARFTIVLTLCLLLLLGAGALTVRYILVELPAEIAQRTAGHAVETAHEIAGKVARAFQVQPRVTISGKTIVEQQTAVLQFVTLEKTLTERQRIDDSWMHSTKTLEVEADFTARAGFDLEKPFHIEVERSGASLRITLPPAQILGVDLRDVRFLRDENGLWNKLTPEDREQALRELRRRVELDARKSDLPQQARAIAEKRLTELLAPGGRDVVFEAARKP
jgi:Protein of unknown function (DUF4230)